MSFHSINIVKGELYTNDFYVKSDDGLTNRPLDGTSGTMQIFELDSDALVLTTGLTINIDEKEFNKAVATLSSGQTSSLQRIVEGAEDQYLKRSRYWGKLTLNGVPGGPNPILAIINKINIL